MKALILAAGYATRLYPITKEYPKPLLEVKGRPIIDYIVEKLEEQRVIDRIYVVTNSKFMSRFKKWAETSKAPEKITLVNDLTVSNQDRLGAIGDINFAISKKKIKDDLLIIGGDNLFSGSLKGFLGFSAKHKALSIGLFRLKQKSDASRYGVAKLNKLNKVIDFQEKPAKPKSNIVAMCLYYIPKEYLKLIKEYVGGKKNSDATGSYIAWIRGNVDIYGYIFKGSWFDIGDHKYFNQAKNNFA